MYKRQGLGGCIVDSGNFDWTKYPEKYSGLCTPDDSYHGVIYTEPVSYTHLDVYKRQVYNSGGSGTEEPDPKGKTETQRI